MPFFLHFWPYLEPCFGGVANNFHQNFFGSKGTVSTTNTMQKTELVYNSSHWCDGCQKQGRSTRMLILVKSASRISTFHG